MQSNYIFGATCLLLSVRTCLGLGFTGFFETNYNETITVCTFDEARGVLLGRTHWPNTPFNEDSASLQGVLVNESWLCGTGATIAGGAYSFSMHISNEAPHPLGTFSFLDKVEDGLWDWSYVRPATDEECEQVTVVRRAENGTEL